MQVQESLFPGKDSRERAEYRTYAYRTHLVRDKSVNFTAQPVTMPYVAAELIQNTISAMAQNDRENIVVIMLSAGKQIVGTNVVVQGGLSGASIAMHQLFKPAIIANAQAIVIGHNHPGNSLCPSDEDIAVTKAAVMAGKLLGIQVLDHIIIGVDQGKFFSFVSKGIFPK